MLASRHTYFLATQDSNQTIHSSTYYTLFPRALIHYILIIVRDETYHLEVFVRVVSDISILLSTRQSH